MRERLLKLKLYQMRAQSHTGFIVSALTLAVGLAAYMKLSNISGWYALALFGFILVANTCIGYFDVKYKIFSKEISINNEHNQEMQELLRLLREKK